jgi:sortase A
MTKRISLTSALFLTVAFVFSCLHGVLSLQAAIPGVAENSGPGGIGPSDSSIGPIDYSLWSPARIRAYKASLSHPVGPPLAILRIPKLRIVAPVLNGMDDLSLNRGVGRIPGTAFPGQAGNIGIAGHRDSFFRRLKDIARGERIELDVAGQVDVYIVDKVYVTGPQDVNVLRSGPAPAITLVTCYPFYYAGSAPQRYIVQALKQAARP